MPRLPSATYRIQFHAGFTFDDAVTVVPYLHALGVSHLYASPILQATSGSTHGYDGTNPRLVNPELGGQEALGRLVQALHENEMRLIVDIVPNHLAANAENPWWVETLAGGRDATAARIFDILWEEGPIVLPVLGAPLDDVLERGELRVAFENGRFWWRYYENAFPWSSESVQKLVENHAPELRNALPENEADPLPESLAPIAGRLNAVADPKIAFRPYLDLQQYELAFWRDGLQRVNYRRFFDIAELVCLRQDDEAVFDATHERIIELASRGWIDGVRIDHVDGLADPEGYLLRLDKALRTRADLPDPYIVVEKILSHDERLPGTWPVAGTTGYEFMQRLNAVFVHPDGWQDIRRSYTQLGEPGRLSALIYEKKRLVIDELFQAELGRLARDFITLNPVAEVADTDQKTAAAFLRTVAAALPVYRTYAAHGALSSQDHHHLDVALDSAFDREPDLARQYAAAFRAVYEADIATRNETELHFLRRFEQFTGPVMAKGLEDTALYDWFPLASFNDVGAPHDPQPSSIEALHTGLTDPGCDYGGMNATSTHDTKRSEDARAIINILSERPKDWLAALERWHAMNDDLGAEWEGEHVPGPPLEAFLYQNLLAIWSGPPPLDELATRMWTFAQKAIRERKRHGSWIDVNTDYETRLERFVRRMLDPNHSGEFINDFDAFHAAVVPWGRLNAIAQTALKIAAPGVPDFYQGTEFVRPTLVDPDNRGTIDFESRKRNLAELDLADFESNTGWNALADPAAADRLKLAITARGLHLRLSHPELFEHGRYEPLSATGVPEGAVIAVARRLHQETVIAAVPRFALTHCDGDLDRAPDIYAKARIKLEGTTQTYDIGAHMRNCPVVLLSV